MYKVAIIMGSDSDLPVMKDCAKMLGKFGIEYDVKVISAHRTPQAAEDFAKNARKNGYGVIIAAAGKAAHLAGVIASMTTLPVIGVPIKTSMMGGLDSLLSTVQMPKGIPVATVAVDGADNAAILAAQIMAVYDETLAEKLASHKANMVAEIEAKNNTIDEKLKEMI